MNIYAKNYLESAFVKITNLAKTNNIVGCIYTHPTMDLNEFNCYYLNSLLKTLAKEQKAVSFLGHFNVNLLKYKQHKATNEFLGSLSSKMFLPCIRITSHSRAIIDNIFSNYISQEIITSNLTSTVSNHLPQFLIATHIFLNALHKKSNIFESDWSKFNREKFILDYFAID